MGERLFPPTLELLVLSSFAGADAGEATEAIELLRAWPSISDGKCLTTFEKISDFVYSKDCGMTLEDGKLFSALQLTAPGSNVDELLSQARSALTKQPWLAGRPREAARALVDEVRRSRAASILTKAAAKIATASDFEGTLAKAGDEVTALAMRSRKQKSKKDLADETLHEIRAVREGLEIVGVELGVPPPDDGPGRLGRLVKLRPSKLYTVGALKKTGKTKFLVYVLRAAVAKGIPAHFLSLEMTDRKVLEWYLSLVTQIDSNRIPSPNLTEPEFRLLEHATTDFLKDPMNISYHPAATLQMVRHEARKFRMAHPDAPHLLMGLDHLGLMKHEDYGANEALAVERTVKGLMQICQEYELALLLLSQCPVATEYKKEPGIEDLKWSGAIAECSEGIFMLHNKQRSSAEEHGPQRDVTIRIFQRDGDSNVRVPMRADLRTGRFWEVAKSA